MSDLHEMDATSRPAATPAHRVRIDSFGCRVNKYDSTVLRAELLASGYEVFEDEGAFDTLIINSCTVTEQADQSVRRILRRVSRTQPQANVVLTGCFAEVMTAQEAESLGTTLRIPNHAKDSVVAQLNARLQRPTPPSPVEIIPEWGRHTRFFFKVQEGCDVRCAFCIIPDARGHSRSLSPDEVIETVKRAVSQGYQEVILAGIHLGAYGRDLPGASGLGRLLRRVLDETDVRRLRLGSLEPWGVRPDLIELLKSSDRLLPSLHLPLQSGSEKTLRAMARPMTSRRYRELVTQIQEARPDLTLWLDVIAGFPGESEEDFQESYDFIASLNFTRLHVFPYSQRKETPAASLPGQVPEPIKKRRVEALMALSEVRFFQQLASRVGSTDEILVELHGRGHTRDNFPVQLVETPEQASIDEAAMPFHPPSEGVKPGMFAETVQHMRGQIVPVTLVGTQPDRLLAVLRKPAP